jgi:hypothetical protein
MNDNIDHHDEENDNEHEVDSPDLRDSQKQLQDFMTPADYDIVGKETRSSDKSRHSSNKYSSLYNKYKK